MSFAIAAITPMFTSCSSDDNNEEENYSPDGENSLTLALHLKSSA